MSNVILNVSCGFRYPVGQDRLVASLDRIGDATDRLFWRDEWPGRSHAEAITGFKVDAFEAALRKGYAKALWLDSQVVAANPLDPVWEHLERSPVLLLRDGWTVGEWTSDHALSIFRIDRDAAMEMPLCYTKVVGIDLAAVQGRLFLARWAELRDCGAFDGPWHNDRVRVSRDTRCRGHRHDQSCASWLSWDMGIPMADMDPFMVIESQRDTPVFRAFGV